MKQTISNDQIDLLVWNLHQDPYYILGPHQVELDGKSVWAIRAYLPHAEKAQVVNPAQPQQEYVMHSIHHPNFFECIIDQPNLFKYQLKVHEYGSDRLVHDPYSFPVNVLTEFDRHLFAEGNHYQIYEKLGAHLIEIDGVKGVYFAVWAPNARNVSVIGEFNHWDGRAHQMRKGDPGVWEIFIPDLDEGTIYKYEVKNAEGHLYEKSDPHGYQQEIRPKTGSIVANLEKYQWQDQTWMDERRNSDPLTKPISIYEMHIGSWMHGNADEPPADGYPIVYAADMKPGARFLTYRELADKLIPYIKDLGFTHLELLPVAEHPFDGSWGYQVIGFYAATSRYGTPQDFMYFVDQCHQNGIGVIVDWVPGHFPKDGHGLALFDGTHLYEPADDRIGEHKGWGTYAFNYERNEVKNFLIANALFWFDKYHIDGIRVDAVASIIYRNYCREPGEWLPNEYGGCEHIAGVEFLKHLHGIVYSYYPGILSIAEESTAWPMVTAPTDAGGLGFNLKWNMGWMHDMLDYFEMDPWFRQFHQNNVTFSLMYAFNENFVLALSHDEIVHEKSAMPGKMPGDTWQKLANLRCLYGYMFAHPGKKSLFMGMEFAQWNEWNVWGDLEWWLMQYDKHVGMVNFIRDLHRLLKQESALHTIDFAYEGFEWMECNDNKNSVISFLRKGKDGEFVVTVCNFTPVLHGNYRIGVPEPGFYQELLNSDATEYWGSGAGNYGGKSTEEIAMHNQRYSLDLCLPPLSTLMFKLDSESVRKNREKREQERLEEQHHHEEQERLKKLLQEQAEQSLPPILG